MPKKKNAPSKGTHGVKGKTGHRKKKDASGASPPAKIEVALPKEGKTKISGIRIRLSAFDHGVLDEAAAKIIETAQRSGAVIHGPVPLPTRIRKFTVNRSTFIHKNARDQFEMRIHSRLIDLTDTTFKTIDSLQSLSLPSGVDIDIKMK